MISRRLQELRRVSQFVLEDDSKNIESAFSMTVMEDDHGKRFDYFVAEKIENCSRSFIAELISDGYIFVNSREKKPSYKLKAGELVSGSIPPPPEVDFEPENIPLDILHEDDDLIVLNKQAGIVVHPAPGNWSGTLVNGLLYHFPDIDNQDHEMRPGIVHRLDKDTSGALVVAKNRHVHMKLSEAFKSRAVCKEYVAVIYGDIKDDSGVIELPIGRHKVDRKKMSVNSPKGKPAETHWFVEERYGCATKIKLNIKTGRTHQIRVHCQSAGHPVVGDPVYSGKKNSFVKKYGKKNELIYKQVKRQMLHSRFLQFEHPRTKEVVSFEAPVPEDINDLIRKLKITKLTS